MLFLHLWYSSFITKRAVYACFGSILLHLTELSGEFFWLRGAIAYGDDGLGEDKGR